MSEYRRNTSATRSSFSNRTNPNDEFSTGSTANTASTTKSGLPPDFNDARANSNRGYHHQQQQRSTTAIDEEENSSLGMSDEERGGNGNGGKPHSRRGLLPYQDEQEYYEDVYPELNNLGKLLSSNESSGGGGKASKVSLQELLKAADADVDHYRDRLSQLRIRMYSRGGGAVPPGGEGGGVDIQGWKEAQYKRRMDHEETLKRLSQEARKIISGNIMVNNNNMRGSQVMTQQAKLGQWRRMLELYVLAPEACMNIPLDPANASGSGAGGGGGDGKENKFDAYLLHLIKMLSDDQTKDEELSELFTEASHMCAELVDVTATAVRDAAEFAAETEDAYHIRLEAFRSFMDLCLEESDLIEEQFRTNGRAAMKIGQQLELAEGKRRQCETASILIRRWWMMENLAEVEAEGDPISVADEVTGMKASSSCRMDPLFTQPENSLQASKTLKQLRSVVRSRGASASTTGAMVDPSSARRFELTSNLIYRTSAALESRLLNSFLEIHAKGGTYEFTSTVKRNGTLDWTALRDLATALMYFDSGRKLHKKYVQQVITTKFPEFFLPKRKPHSDPNDNESSSDDNDELELDMDVTRTQLSTLFHRVSEVCTTEFALIANVFLPTETNHENGDSSSSSSSTHSVSDSAIPFQVARALLQRIIRDRRCGLQARINELLESVDRNGDFDAGSKKLDTFVVVHEKAAGLFSLLREAAEQNLIPVVSISHKATNTDPTALLTESTTAAPPKADATTKRHLNSLLQYLTSQEVALSNGQRRGYLNLELRLLHHECCAGFDRIGARIVKPHTAPSSRYLTRNIPSPKASSTTNQTDTNGLSFVNYHAPIMPLDKEHLKRDGYHGLLHGVLKHSVLRQPLIHATDSLARATLMFGVHGGTMTNANSGGVQGDATARVISALYSQMCAFYGDSFLFPVIETTGELLNSNPPTEKPTLPFDEDFPPHDLGVDEGFWMCMERVHSAAKSFDRELWAEQRVGSMRVWEILVGTGSHTQLTLTREKRLRFFTEVETRGEAAILKALDALSAHIKWILVSGESMLATGGNRLLHNLTHDKDKYGGGPYAVPAGSSLEAPNSPAVQSLAYCLRAQFTKMQAALTPQSLSAFWTALSMRLYDAVIGRLLLHYYVSNIGAVILSRDVEALRKEAMRAGTDHSHWETLRELLTLYMTPPNALKTILVGPEGDVHSGKGLFHRAGQDQSLVFMSRRIDFRLKTHSGIKTNGWATELLSTLGCRDPSETPINISVYTAERKHG